MSQNPFSSFDNAYMASLNNAYRDAETGYKPRSLPEGKYQTVISAFALKPSTKFPDELNLALGFEVLSGDQKGVTAYKYYSITPEHISRLKNDMLVLGIDLEDDVSKLGELTTADKILDQIVDITIKHTQKKDGKGFYQNVYVNRSLGKISEGFQEVPEGEDDECPFD